MEILGAIVLLVAGAFWVFQLIDVVLVERRQFESHTHRLVWFLAIVIGNIVGAIWYFVWKRQPAHSPGPSSPQIPGAACPVCKRRVTTITEGVFCTTCRIVVHEQCSPDGVCPDCGKRLSAPDTDRKD